MDRDFSFTQKMVRYNTRVNVINGVFAVIAANLASPYFALFAARIGASDFQITLLSSVPSLICIFTLIPGAMLIDSFRDKKKITGSIIFAHKVFYLLLVIVPFVGRQLQPWLFVVLVGFMNLPGSIGGMGFQSSIGDIFDSDTIGVSMAKRNKYSTAIGTLILFISGLIITELPGSDRQTIILYQILFVLSFIVGQGEVFSFFKFRGIKDNINEMGEGYLSSFKEVLKSIPSEKNYLIFMISSLMFYFGWQMGWPLFNLYTIRILKANEVWMSVISIASSLSSIAAYSVWAKFANKKGNTYAIFIATIGMSVTPLLYAVSRNLVMLVAFNILVGISTAGTTQILFNLLIEVTPSKNRTKYIAIYNTLINISAAISPIIGNRIKDVTNIYIALVVVSMLRFTGCIAFLVSSKLKKKLQIGADAVNA